MLKLCCLDKHWGCRYVDVTVRVETCSCNTLTFIMCNPFRQSACVLKQHGTVNQPGIILHWPNTRVINIIDWVPVCVSMSRLFEIHIEFISLAIFSFHNIFLFWLLNSECSILINFPFGSNQVAWNILMCAKTFYVDLILTEGESCQLVNRVVETDPLTHFSLLSKFHTEKIRPKNIWLVR